jgi:hypothetical protein
MKCFILTYEHHNFSKILVENRQKIEVYLTVQPSMFQQKFTPSLDIGFLLLMGYHCYIHREQGFKFHQSEGLSVAHPPWERKEESSSVIFIERLEEESSSASCKSCSSSS